MENLSFSSLRFWLFWAAVFFLISVNANAAASGSAKLSLNKTAMCAERAVQSPAVFIIGGRLTSVGVPLVGVTVTLSGSASATQTTASNGSYFFPSLPEGGNYMITVSPFPDYVFTPPSQTVTNLSISRTVDFTATEICSAPNCRTNGRIVFVRGADIYTANQTGAELLNLTSSAAVDSEPSYSPDNTKILFVSNRDGNQEIYTMNLNGTNLVRLTANTFVEGSPSFSPDGTQIVFVSNRDGNSEIYTMNTDGTNQLRLTNNAVIDQQPKFSPDGGKIVFARALGSQAGALTSVFSINAADGSNAVQLTVPTNGNDSAPSFSSDGEKILFLRFNTASFTSSVITINTNGSNEQTVVQNFSSAGPLLGPSFSPDGKKIIYFEQSTFTSPPRYRVASHTISSGAKQVLFDDGANPGWQSLRPLVRKTPFDFDGDQRADVSVFRPNDGTWYLSNSTLGFSARQFGVSTDQPVAADYDGDGKTDIAVFRKNADSAWYILQSSNNTFRYQQWGASNQLQAILFDRVAPGDYDGDGKTDLAVWRLTDDLGEPARFLILQSSTNVSQTQQWGGFGDALVPAADYDGDGKTDFAIFRGNIWYINQSRQGFRSVRFGASGDRLEPADYDGDGKADIAVFRPSTGVWYLQQSAVGTEALTFGLGTDLPVPADYDGDGKTDIAVFRDGTWYLNRSTLGFTSVAFGASTDKPIPNALIP